MCLWDLSFTKRSKHTFDRKIALYIYVYIYSFEAGKIIFLPLLTGFYFVLVFRLGLAALRNRWFRLWVRLELNIISFIPIFTARGSLFQLENRVKYFLTQAVASL